jgi:hypothetical protein
MAKASDSRLLPFSANPGQRPLGVNRVVSAMSAMSPLYPQKPTSSVRSATSEKCH